MKHTPPILFLILTLVIPVHAQYTGRVFLDENGNGQLDQMESGRANVLVTDGLQVVKTDSEGVYALPAREDARFITITTPDGYHAPAFFHRAGAPGTDYDFALQKVKSPNQPTRFIHITDTESANNDTRWVEMLQAYIQHEKPDFLIHTGDICYEDGMRFHAEAMNTAIMGVPTYYCVGNHDLVAGEYGEALFEELFGPPWYSFEAGGVHYIVTPMLRGDYKPSYTKKDVYLWLRNLLSQLDRDQPKFIFNHDLLTGEDQFIYGISDEEFINLNDYNLKAWVYGHWHNSFYRPHGESGVVSICTGVAQKGGIDHSLSQFRVFDVEPDGNFTTEIVQTFVDHELTIVSPAPVANLRSNTLPILVNAYNTAAKTADVQYRIGDAAWQSLRQQTNWTWTGAHFLDEDQRRKDTLDITVTGRFNDGEERRRSRRFHINRTPPTPNSDGYWPNLLMNGRHHPGETAGPRAPLALDWVANISANIYMSAPVVAEGKVFVASYDNGDARNCYLLAYDYITGRQLWRFSTENSVKGAIAYENGRLFATDMVGNVYAVEASSGALAWQTSLDMNVLPGYVSGTVAENGVVYTGDGSAFSALDQRDGNLRWTNEAWNGGVGGPPVPTIGPDIIVTSSNWNALYCHDLNTGELLWKKRDLGLRFRDAAPVYYRDTLFVGTQESMLAIAPKSGEILYAKETEFNLKTNSTPLIAGDLIIVGTASDGVVAFNRRDFSVAWKFETGPAQSMTSPYTQPVQMTVEASPVLVNGSDIYVGASDGVFYCLDVETGEANWQFEVGAPILATVAVTDDRIFLADTAGNLYCMVGM